MSKNLVGTSSVNGHNLPPTRFFKSGVGPGPHVPKRSGGPAQVKQEEAKSTILTNFNERFVNSNFSVLKS